MGRKRHTPEQIITALREAEVGLARGKSVKLISRELGITEQTYYRWRKGVRGDEGGPGPGTPREGARAGECTAEASGGEPDAGQADPGGSGEGKLLSPERRRRAVVHVRQRLGASERHACRVLGQSRSTQHRRRKVRADKAALRSDVVRLASRFGRYGYRQITKLLRIEGWRVNHKRVERIWREEGLKVPRRQPKRGRLWLNDGSCSRRSISSFSTRSEASTVSRLTADLLTPTVSAISPITRPYFRVLTPAIRTSSIRSATAPGLRIAAYAGTSTSPPSPAPRRLSRGRSTRTFRSDR